MELELVELGGTPYEMGLRHGERYAAAIREFAEERVRLAGGEAWTGRKLPREQVLELAEACLPYHREFTPSGLEELEGMAKATGLTLAELLIVNGFTDFIDTVFAAGAADVDEVKAGSGGVPGTADGAGEVPRRVRAAADDCTAMLVPSARAEDGQALFAQTWDMHASGARHVLLLRGRPEGAPDFLTFTSVGCVGMIGMNEAGLVVGINNLMAGDGRPGVMWTFAVRELLRLETVDEAIELLDRLPLAGAHNYLLLDADGHGANLEATGSRRHLTRLDGESLVHTNHCLHPSTREVERERPAASQESTTARLERAGELLAGGTITPDRLQRLMADEPIICVSPRPPLNVATCGAVVMRPATREFWAVKGSPAQGSYRRYGVTA